MKISVFYGTGNSCSRYWCVFCRSSVSCLSRLVWSVVGTRTGGGCRTCRSTVYGEVIDSPPLGSFSPSIRCITCFHLECRGLERQWRMTPVWGVCVIIVYCHKLISGTHLTITCLPSRLGDGFVCLVDGRKWPSTVIRHGRECWGRRGVGTLVSSSSFVRSVCLGFEGTRHPWTVLRHKDRLVMFPRRS